MAKSLKTKKPVKTEVMHISFTNKNYMIIGIGILFIIIGYVFMAENSVDGFLPTVIAPILLVLGYCVVVPYGILFKDKSLTAAAKVTADNTETKGTSNIKSV